MFAMLGSLIILLAGLVSIVLSLWLLVLAFSESIWWGLACLLIPFASLIFIVVHWDKAGPPFLMSLATIPVMFMGAMMAGI